MSATTSSLRETYLKARYRFSLAQVVAELLQKRWMDALVPFVVMVVVLVTFTQLIPNYTSADNLINTAREFGEFGFPGAGVDPGGHRRRHRPLHRRDLRHRRPGGADHVRLPGLAAGRGHPRHPPGGRASGSLQRSPHRVSPHARLPHHPGDDDHLPRRVRHLRTEVQQPAHVRRAGQFHLGVAGLGVRLRHPVQHVRAGRGGDPRPHLPQPFAPRLAPDRHRRGPPGRASRRHRDREVTLLDLRRLGRPLLHRRLVLRRTPGQRPAPTPA